MKYNNFLWNNINFHKIQYIFVKYNEYLWNNMNFREIIWIFVIYYKIPIASIFVKYYLYSWNTVYFYEIQSIFMKYYLYLWNAIYFREIQPLITNPSSSKIQKHLPYSLNLKTQKNLYSTAFPWQYLNLPKKKKNQNTYSIMNEGERETEMCKQISRRERLKWARNSN